MPKLTITTDDEKTVLVSVQIKNIDPAKATVVILEALAKLEPAKKTRCDKGKRRSPTLVLPPAASSEAA